MGHSISGIYGLEYVNQYEKEVQAFVELIVVFLSRRMQMNCQSPAYSCFINPALQIDSENESRSTGDA